MSKSLLAELMQLEAEYDEDLAHAAIALAGVYLRKNLINLSTYKKVVANIEHSIISHNPHAYYADDYNEEQQLDDVRREGDAIHRIKNPSEAVKLAAVMENGYAIEHIKDPSEELQLIAIKYNGQVIECIKNPTEDVQLAAVREDGYAIQYIDNPSEAVQLAAVTSNWQVIRYIKNPTEAARMAAFEGFRNGD